MKLHAHLIGKLIPEIDGQSFLWFIFLVCVCVCEWRTAFESLESWNEKKKKERQCCLWDYIYFFVHHLLSQAEHRSAPQLISRINRACAKMCVPTHIITMKFSEAEKSQLWKLKFSSHAYFIVILLPVLRTNPWGHPATALLMPIQCRFFSFSGRDLYASRIAHRMSHINMMNIAKWAFEIEELST